MWSITLNAKDVMNGSVHPNRNGTMIKWPDELTGRNSVSPCTIPMTTAWPKISIRPPRVHRRRSWRPMPALSAARGCSRDAHRRLGLGTSSATISLFPSGHDLTDEERGQHQGDG